MKKVQLFALTTLFATLCAGCGGKTDSSSNNGVVSSNVSLGENSSSVHHDPVTITYTAWNLGSPDSAKPNLDRLMIEEFEKEYPWITVEIIEIPKNPDSDKDMGWKQFLTAQASIEELPDVFMLDTIPDYITNNWVMDITSLVESDPEYQLLSPDVRKSAEYEGMTFALPTAIFYQGYLVNKTLFTEQNQKFPTATTTWDQFLTTLKRASNHSVNNAVAGIEGIEHIVHVYASQLNQNYEWFTFDGKKFNLDSVEFESAVNFYLDIYKNKSISYDGLTDEERIQYFGEGKHPHDNEKLLAKWVGSWELGSLQSDINTGKKTCNYDFIGFPSVEGVKKTPISMDFNAVSSQTKHPEEAYLLAKWMGFSKKGYATKLNLSRTTKDISVINYAPLIADNELLDEYFALYPSFSNYRKVIESGSFITEPVKTMVGYDQVRYHGLFSGEDTMFTLLDKVLRGEIVLADVARSYNDKANEIYNTYVKSFNEAIQKYYIKAA